jgi:Mg2+ and Co2+ transporter CorA
VPVPPGDASVPSPDATWFDTIDADDATLTTVARTLGFPEPAIGWLVDPDRSLRPRVVQGALLFGVTTAGDLTTLVLASGSHVLTVHAAADGLVDAAAAHLVVETAPGSSPASVLGLVDELVDRYEQVIERLGRDHEQHAVAVIGRSHGRESSQDVVADGLRLASSIGDAQRRIRRLHEVLNGLRRLAPTNGDSRLTAEAIDVRERALTALESDLDGLDRRLELTTDARMSLISARQNEINKAIGAWGGVFAVNAVITGWYGMNIDDLPGSSSWVIAGSVMAVVTVVLIAWFHRIDWL